MKAPHSQPYLLYKYKPNYFLLPSTLEFKNYGVQVGLFQVGMSKLVLVDFILFLAITSGVAYQNMFKILDLLVININVKIITLLIKFTQLYFG